MAPQQNIYELFLDYAQAQLDMGNGTMMVVRGFDDALRLLELHNPHFKILTRRESLDL